ncbi:MAG: glycoside hydrolase family 28 protein [Bacteroidota bacterium]|nr:glycoside hydrolase family 28 protein [Bacteroidota bacterium]
MPVVKKFMLTVFLTVIFIQTPTCQPNLLTISQEIILPIKTPFDMPQLQRPEIPVRQFDIRDYGAKEGGVVKNTKAIKTAIEAASRTGGGTIIIPKGKWLTGAIHLDNNINLHLTKYAELLFSQEVEDYLPVVFSRHEDVECYKYSAFIYANGKTNIAITGEGTLNGQGKPWWKFKVEKISSEQLLFEMAKIDVPVEKRIFDGTDGYELRPAFFQPMNCKGVLVEGVTFLFGAFWTITPTYCENVIIRKIKIITWGEYGDTPNGDGVNPSSSKNVLIEDCEFNTGDDCVAIKAGRDKDGIRVGRPSENIVIRNIRGLSGHGGIVIGSETSGGVRNIYAVNCQFKGTDRIVRIKTARGRGGIIENMWFANLTGDDILKEAIHLNMLYTPQGPPSKRMPAQPVSQSTPMIRNIHFENIKFTQGKSYAIELLGIPEMLIENISFNSIAASGEKGINFSDVSGIRIHNAKFNSNISPILTITDGENISIDSVTFSAHQNPLVKIEGENSKNIVIRKTNILNTDTVISTGVNVSKQAVKFEE